MESFFPKIYKISLKEGPSKDFVNTNLKGFPKIGNLIFFLVKKMK